ncbi:MAG: TetR/AcrR family transcriptional regulator [Sphingomonadales bacterium]|nr:TetR/AcrR family transcriptional regulator [Sphingomonadales bacterium]NCP00208.1 TetR/AcrR family transcriptional regulator [Sphingomonadales bacterium]NCP49925.1 TetR/AcrR family transcriptional regulator [Sphingomonadales bacterium]NCQ10016.1 TetR/AcrR family transcriptional regulator [Sphingomonadales bacterium]NCQ49802.1 TetR/AcrR family transcriptional regulator [Sphingomonadales bacterium]
MNNSTLQTPSEKPSNVAGEPVLHDARSRHRLILQEATRLFLEEGYGSATTNTLVARVGGSKSTIYSYFESKEKLFGAVVDHVLTQLKTATEDFDRPDGDLKDCLVDLGVKLQTIVLSADHIALARMVIGEAHRFPEIGAIYHEHGPALAQEGVVDFLLAHDAMPGASIEDVRDAAEWFTGRLIHRAFIHALCGPGDYADLLEPTKIAQDTARTFVQRFSGPARESAA